MKNIFNYTRTFLGKTIAFLAMVVVLMTFFDYLFKWQIYSFLLSTTNKLFEIFSLFIFESIALVWLIVLSYLFLRLQKQVKESKPNELHEQITILKTEVKDLIKKFSESSASQIKSLEINEYISRSRMPSYFLDDLHKSLKKLPDSLKGFGDEVLKLAQEKLYNPR